MGLGITFLWIGVLILRAPEAWGIGYIQPWALKLLPLPIKEMMISAALLDILAGVFLLTNIFTWLGAFIGATHLVSILIVSGITEITVRDIGLLAACVALACISFPSSVRAILEKFVHVPQKVNRANNT